MHIYPRHLKNRGNKEYDLLRRPQRACLETFYVGFRVLE